MEEYIDVLRYIAIGYNFDDGKAKPMTREELMATADKAVQQYQDEKSTKQSDGV